jgi:hypothetical protein
MLMQVSKTPCYSSTFLWAGERIFPKITDKVDTRNQKGSPAVAHIFLNLLPLLQIQRSFYFISHDRFLPDRIWSAVHSRFRQLPTIQTFD